MIATIVTLDREAIHDIVNTCMIIPHELISYKLSHIVDVRNAPCLRSRSLSFSTMHVAASSCAPKICRRRSTFSQTTMGVTSPQHLTSVASHLVGSGLITQWQFEKLERGKYRGFFLGKYKLLGHIGSGGMGSVYLAEHLHMRRRVAISRYSRAVAWTIRLISTASIAKLAQPRALDHPNIVRAYDIDSEGSLHYRRHGVH